MASTRKRLANFTHAEKVALIDIVEKEKNILENKKTDSVTSKQKEACWGRIATEFNSKAFEVRRDGNALKNCWDNLKKKTRKHYAEGRRERSATGGGSMDDLENLVYDRIKVIIQPSVDRLFNAFDSDNGTDYQQQHNASATCDDENIIEALDDAGQSVENPSYLRSWHLALSSQKTSPESMPQSSEDDYWHKDVKPTISVNSAFKPSVKGRLTRSKISLRQKGLLASMIWSQPSVNNLNKKLINLERSKMELVEMMKEDMRVKSKIEIQILRAQLQKELLSIKLLERELAPHND